MNSQEPDNGRSLTDDVMDLFLAILTNGKMTQDNVGPHNDLLTDFPYLGAPHNVERYDPDLWTDEFYFLNQPGQSEIQSNLFYDYRTSVDAYPKWQAWMRQKQPRLLVIWGKHDLSFDLGEPERYRKDVPKAEVHILDAGHFALDTAADQIAALVQGFVGSSREGFVARGRDQAAFRGR